MTRPCRATRPSPLQLCRVDFGIFVVIIGNQLIGTIATMFAAGCYVLIYPGNQRAKRNSGRKHHLEMRAVLR